MREIDGVSRTVSYYETRGHHYPLVTERKCIVCMHPDRLWIENAYFEGFTTTAILARLDDPDSVSGANITGHFRNGHVPPHMEILQAAQWERAARHGLTPEAYEETQTAHVVALEMTMDRFRRRVATDPQFEPDYKDGLAAIKLMNEMRSAAEQTGGASADDLFVALSMFMMHTQTVLSRYLPIDAERAMSDLTRLLESDPVLKRLSAKVQEEGMEATTSLEDEEDYSEEIEVLPSRGGELEIIGEPTDYSFLDISGDDTPFDERD